MVLQAEKPRDAIPAVTKREARSPFFDLYPPTTALPRCESLLCILHCVATPLLLVVLPALQILERHTHALFALSILCIGLLAFVPGYRRHRRWRVVLLGLVGFGMLSAGVLVPEAAMSETAEVVVTVLGGATLITAHLRNAYFCQLCRACEKEPCTGELTNTVRV